MSKSISVENFYNLPKPTEKTVKLLSSGNIQPFIEAEKKERQNHRKVGFFEMSKLLVEFWF